MNGDQRKSLKTTIVNAFVNAQENDYDDFLYSTPGLIASDLEMNEATVEKFVVAGVTHNEIIDVVEEVQREMGYTLVFT